MNRCLPERFASIALCALLAACAGGGGGGAESPPVATTTTIQGAVIDGYVAAAVVCLDANRNGHCDAAEPRATTGASGDYQLAVPEGSTGPLLAEVIGGQSRDADEPGGIVSASYTMATPGAAYSVNITPFTTLVYLSGETSYALAEDIVRNEIVLPPRYDLRLASPPAAGSLVAATSRSIVAALKATAGNVDFASPRALATVVAALPAAMRELPVVVINTKGAAPIVSKEDYVDGTLALTNPVVSSQPVTLNIKIRGRGHLSWLQPKKPYKVQVVNDAAWAAIPDVLGMKKNRNFALLADYLDRTLVRNKLAYSLASSSVFSDGQKWTPSGQHVEVWVNGEYEGVYLLCEDIRLAPERVNVRKMSTDPAANDVTGGYIVEVDERLDCDPMLQIVTPQGVRACVDTPDETAITPAQLAYAKSLVNSVEQDLYGSGRLERINPASFADWYLLQELFKNVDGSFFSSDYLWKDADTAAAPLDRLVNMGPIWDMDMAAGNQPASDLWKPEGCYITKQVPNRTNWFAKLAGNPEFVKLVTDRWKQKRPALGKFVDAGIDTYARRLAQAEQRNFARWPILGLPLESYYAFSTYEEHLTFLKSFLDQRIAWLDQAFASPQSFDAMCK